MKERMIRLNLCDGGRLDLAADELWRLTDELVAADGEVVHGVGTAAALRLAAKALGDAGEVDLTAAQTDALRGLRSFTGSAALHVRAR